MKDNMLSKNRMISMIFLGIFIVALIAIGFTSYKIASGIKERNDLLAQRDALYAEQEWQNENDDDEYLTIYVKDNYSIYDKSDTIFIFSKN